MNTTQFYAAIHGDLAYASAAYDELSLLNELKAFEEDVRFDALRDAVRRKQYDEVLKYCNVLHEKSESLGFTNLAELSGELAEQLRPQTHVIDALLLNLVEAEYTRISDQLRYIEE